MLSSLTRIFLVIVMVPYYALAGRTTVPLDGTWDIEATTETAGLPAAFTHTIPVPGLADLAVPLFTGQPGAYWYRTNFSVAGAVPAVAYLKVHKAMYGTRVWLNGVYIGEHLPCFTPGYFDLTPALLGNAAQNVLVIRVGIQSNLPDTVANGHDQEKSGSISGIYDSVQLILSGTPHITNVLTAPDLTGSKVRALVKLRNAGSAATVPLRGFVYEAAGGTPAGTGTIPSLTIPAGGETTAVLDIALPGFTPWTPEEPFLYRLALSTGADSTGTRFGMRTVACDLTPLGNKMILNGQAYMLLGTNIAIRRFENDPLRSGLPWDEDWVRTVIRTFKSVNWNSARFTIGFPPEAWYRIADEEGFLVQDEFPIWTFSGTHPPSSELAAEFTEWIEERANHPCVFMWDAMNETASDIVTAAAESVLGLDPQNRPWNFGYSHPAFEGISEDHPYSAGSSESAITKVTWNFSATKKTPGIINEYAYLWLTREGDATRLTMGNTFMDYPTVESRRLYRYRVTAAATERFRMGSDIGGIMHFCSLTNCGTTGDDWLPDITTPEFPAEFIHYMPDAFSPLMVSINTGFTPRAPGSGESIEVVLVNDSYQAWTGPVRLAVQEKGLLLSEQSQTASVAALSKTAVNFTVTYPAYGPVRICRLEASLSRNGTRVRSVRDLALGTAKPVMPEDICDCGPDSTPPGAVSNVRVTGAASQAVSLAWDPASDPESQIAQYDVYRNDSLYAFVPGTVFVDTDVTERSSYAYQVAAVNQGCREGARSAAVNAVTPDDTIPPLIVSAVSVWNTGVIVRFNEAVEQGSAETITNYALSDNAGVVSAGLDPADPAQVFLGTSAMSDGVSYVLTVSNVLDRAITPHPVPAGSQAGFTVSCPQVNWAAGKPVTATSSAAQNPAIYAVDGDLTTRWSSEFSDSQSLTVDLGAPPVYIEKVIIHWERAYAQEYFLQVDDGTGWTDVRHETNCQGGADTTVVNQMARWIRMDGIKRATAWGYSIWEFEVFPSCAGASPVRQAWRTESTLPGSFELSCAGPNPMARSGPVIYYGLPVDSKVLLRVYDISGRLVKTLVNGSEKGGYHTVLFDGQADGRGALSNGVYFCHMRAGGSEKVIGFQLIR